MTKLYGFSFDITGDYAHFRHLFTQSFFETLLAPPKTTVSGLLAAALGLNEEKEVIELNNNILTGVKILGMEGFAREIIIAWNLKGGSIQPTPIYRNLIVKPHYKIFVASEDKEFLETIRQSLFRPEHPLYLGISEALATIKEVSRIVSIQASLTNIVRTIGYVIDKEKIPVHKVNNSEIIIPAKRYHTVKSFKLTKKGRIPDEYIDLVMFYGGYLEYKKPVQSYNINGEMVALF